MKTENLENSFYFCHEKSYLKSIFSPIPDQQPHLMCRRGSLSLSTSELRGVEPCVCEAAHRFSPQMEGCLASAALRRVFVSVCLQISTRCGRDYKVAAVYLTGSQCASATLPPPLTGWLTRASGPVGRCASLMRRCRCKNSAAHLLAPITNVCQSPSRWCCVLGTHISVSDCSGFPRWCSWRLHWGRRCQHVNVVLKEHSFTSLSTLQIICVTRWILSEACMFCLCLCGFSPSSLASSHRPIWLFSCTGSLRVLKLPQNIQKQTRTRQDNKKQI